MSQVLVLVTGYAHQYVRGCVNRNYVLSYARKFLGLLELATV
jgi:hypothetical protein